MNPRKQLPSLCLFFLTSLIIFLLCLGFATSATNRFSPVTTMNLDLSQKHNALTVESIQKISERLFPKRYSFTTECSETLVSGEKVTPVLTTFSYFSLYGATLSGEGITQQHQAHSERVAVISDTLAVKLFFNTDCLGKTILIDSQPYTVSGVYHAESSPLKQLCTDGKERVYIPYTCAHNHEKKLLHTIIYDNMSTGSVIEQLNTGQYYSTDFTEKMEVIDNFTHIIYFTIFAFFSILLLKVWKALCKRLITDIKESLKTHYAASSLLHCAHKYLLLFLAGAGIPIVLIIIFLSADFSIYIPSKHLPYDNLFDISYYINAIKENAHNINSLSLTGDTFLTVFYRKTFTGLLWLTGLFIPVFTVFSIKLSRLVKTILNKIL